MTKRIYAGLDVTIEPLRINECNLNASRMLDMMAVKTTDGPIPLYLQTVRMILREMRIQQQEKSIPFKYIDFKTKVLAEALSEKQNQPLALRLDLLESFLPPGQVDPLKKMTKKESKKQKSYDVHGNDWTSKVVFVFLLRSGHLLTSLKPSTLTIVDLSCPFVSPESACALFSICLGIFLEQEMTTGRVVALDEAHKVTIKSPS